MSNINLRKDCEAFYTFDQRSFDSQRNVIQDRSGYGRHAEASGGPTIGVNGPDNFEAASFDGSDDSFSDGDFHTNDPVGDATEVTLAGVGSQEQNGDLAIISDYYFGVGLRLTIGNDVKAVYEDSVQDTVLDVNLSTEHFSFYATRLKINESLDVIRDGEVLDQTSISGGDSTYATDTDAQLEVGRNIWQSADFPEAELAWSGMWTRALSDAEIDYLNRLTGPRRAQL